MIKVKPLVWIASSTDERDRLLAGGYSITEDPELENGFELKSRHHHERYFKTLNEAKAAAQADKDALILGEIEYEMVEFVDEAASSEKYKEVLSALERYTMKLHDQLHLALKVIRCIPEPTLNELADQQLQILNKSLGEM